MKKLIAVALIAAMGLSMAACSNAKSGSSAAADAKVGVAISNTAEADGESAEFDGTVTAVLVGSDGKIIDVEIDTIQLTPSLEGGVLSEVDLRTKYEKGDDYGMVAYAGAKAEWFAQIDAFEDYCVGKTAEEVGAIALEGGKATDADLTAGCTIAVAGHVADVVKAAAAASASEKTVAGADSLGLSITALDESDEESASYACDVAVVTVDANGKMTSVFLDVIQASAPIAEGAFGETTINTKKELGDNYGMVAYAGAKAEWYAQAAAVEKYLVGKTDTASVALEGGKPTDADLAAGCTIAISDMLANVEKAVAAAKYNLDD